MTNLLVMFEIWIICYTKNTCVWKWLSDCYLTPTHHFFRLWREQDNLQWNDDDVRFVLEQHA